MITGTAPNVSSDTTYNFTIRASDGINTTDRNFQFRNNGSIRTFILVQEDLYGGTGASDTSVVTGWYTSGNDHRISGGGNANNDRLYVYKSGSSRTGVGYSPTSPSNNSVTIPADHNKFKVVVSSYSTSSHGVHFGWGGGSQEIIVDIVLTGLILEMVHLLMTFQAIMPGNAYHFTIGVNCGQNCNNQIQITQALSFNSANPP